MQTTIQKAFGQKSYTGLTTLAKIFSVKVASQSKYLSAQRLHFLFMIFFNCKKYTELDIPRESTPALQVFLSLLLELLQKV